MGGSVCPLIAGNIFETIGNHQVSKYSNAGNLNLCSKLNSTGQEDVTGSTCCSREELEALSTRWTSTKSVVYSNRIKGWAGVLRQVINGEKFYQDHIDQISKLKAVKLDCISAAEEVKKYLDRSGTSNKSNIAGMWEQWQTSA